jgi:hypothetical protein
MTFSALGWIHGVNDGLPRDLGMFEAAESELRDLATRG